MENYFICPHCHGHLKVGNHIIFRIRNNKKEFGLILLNPQIGNYESVTHPSFVIEDGDLLDFYCPVCHHSLEADFDPNLTFVRMIDEKNKENDIYFSRIAGEQSTYQVSENKVRKTGKHSGRYTYFKMPPKHKRFLKT